MATAEQIEADINSEIDGITEDLYSSLQDDVDLAINKVDSVRKEINSVLMEYSKEDGTISESRIRTLLNELDDIEQGLGEQIEDSLSELADSSAKKTSKKLIGGIVAVAGVSLAFGGSRPKRDDIVKDANKYVFDRELNGMKVGKRITALSGSLRDTMQQSVRYGVNIGESVTKISRRVKKAVDKATWQVKRIVTTEIPSMFRSVLATVGGKMGILKGVKIIDNRGRHRYHETHECYKLAEKDPYGWGKGVYKTTDTHVFDPHPQCTAYFHYVINPDKVKDGDNNADE